jgi:hypothetical protein
MKMSAQNGNLSGSERTWSAIFGTALSLLVLRRANPVLRSLAVAAGAGLLARAVAGHCGVKAALTGETSLGKGLQRQWSSMLGGQTKTFDAQESVEELADPVAVQEGNSASAAAEPPRQSSI